MGADVELVTLAWYLEHLVHLMKQDGLLTTALHEIFCRKGPLLWFLGHPLYQAPNPAPPPSMPMIGLQIGQATFGALPTLIPAIAY